VIFLPPVAFRIESCDGVVIGHGMLENATTRRASVQPEVAAGKTEQPVKAHGNKADITIKADRAGRFGSIGWKSFAGHTGWRKTQIFPSRSGADPAGGRAFRRKENRFRMRKSRFRQPSLQGRSLISPIRFE